MKNRQLHQAFELHVCDIDCWNERPLTYHFFEIVHILDGSGVRVVNHNRFSYAQGSIFLFTPLDCRGFDISTPTRFCSIRFSEVFLGQCRSAPERLRIAHWLKQLEHLFFHHNRFQELLIGRPGDGDLLRTLVATLVAEYEPQQPYREENLQHLVQVVLNILARNVNAEDPTGLRTAGMVAEPLINRLLLHLRLHIHCPEKLRVEYLAAHFHLSANYVGEYFRKFAGESLQHYLRHYKMWLVQQRLTHSALAISQIADELGFTDESHLSRQFRKHSGMSPAEYRKQAKRGLICSPEPAR
ncbi:AraC family transcriptional regulator [Hymenobacter sp.]|uniref:helix-turn-helix domain-containing protein n=1 Tax=Hymenobacter sp. TaxID=1898978 RepID=UPI00286C2E22|nr:AraC family transcriptional regulator [Hymenobacter sp.]